MKRFLTPLLAAFLCGTALAGCASDETELHKMVGGDHAARDGAKDTAGDLDSGIRQAQLLRMAGNYEGATRILSQLMLVAADDPRVVSEYGKVLAQQGRAQDATQFLTRAVQLRGDDWTTYSALGVAYDQLGNQQAARMAYERALALKPGEPSVLSNYGLSRMLAGDPLTARRLMTMAAQAGGASDPKIARDIAMVDRMAPQTDSAPIGYAAQAPAPHLAHSDAPPPHSVLPATQAPSAVVQRLPASAMPQPNGAPHSLLPQAMTTGQVAPGASTTRRDVVMQKVPFDPLAGPVAAHSVASVKPVRHLATASKPAQRHVAEEKSSVKPAAGTSPPPALRMAQDAGAP